MRTRLAVAAAALAALAGCIPIPETVRVPPPALAGLKRGINAGNALDAPTEGAWGPALADPPPSLLAEATYQLSAQGAPFIETWTDGNTYLFDTGPKIYPCIGGLSGVAATGPFG